MLENCMYYLLQLITSQVQVPMYDSKINNSDKQVLTPKHDLIDSPFIYQYIHRLLVSTSYTTYGDMLLIKTL